MCYSCMIRIISTMIKSFKTALNKGYEADRCSVCHSAFSIILRIHKCKRCQRFVCYACGKHNSAIVLPQGRMSDTQHRVCVLCKQDSDCIDETIVNCNMKWGKNSDFQSSWESKLKVRHEDYEDFIKLYYQNQKHYQESSQLIEKDVLLGRTDFRVFNFSMREFFYKMQKDKPVEAVRKTIANVLYAVTCKFPTMGYCQGMSSVAAFLLAFSSEASAFQIFCDMITNVLPTNLYNHSNTGTSLIGLLAEVYFVKKQFFHYCSEVKGQKFDQDTEDKLTTIMDLIGSKCFLMMFVSNMTFQNLMFVWEQMKNQRSFVVMDKALIAIIYLFHQSLQQRETHYKFVERYIQLMEHSSFVQIYREIVINPEERKRVVDEYYTGISLEWNKETKRVSNRLSKMSKFTEAEIESVRKEFAKGIDNSESGWGLQHWLRFARALTNTESYKRSNNIVEGFDKLYFQNMFVLFDEQGNGLIDFREFIIGVSILVRGTLKEKINLYAQTLQDSNKSLSYERFWKLVKQVVTLIHSLFDQDQQPQVEEERFKEKMNLQFASKDKIMMSEVYVIMNDNYINTATLQTMDDNTFLIDGLIESMGAIHKS